MVACGGSNNGGNDAAIDAFDNVIAMFEKFRHKKELHEDEMDGEWLEENYTFSKDGTYTYVADSIKKYLLFAC